MYPFEEFFAAWFARVLLGIGLLVSTSFIVGALGGWYWLLFIPALAAFMVLAASQP